MRIGACAVSPYFVLFVCATSFRIVHFGAVHGEVLLGSMCAWCLGSLNAQPFYLLNPHCSRFTC